jgi:uncharacterized membrane protein
VLDAGGDYFRGLVALGIAYGLWRAMRAMSSEFEQTGVRPTLYLLLVILVAPPALGWLIRHLLYPWMRRVRMLRAVLRGEDRLFAEFTPDSRRGFPVALLNWPNDSVRSFCVVTATYPDLEPGREVATVFVPGAPDPRRGKLRVVHLDELEIIDWTLTECLRLHVTCGTHSRGLLHRP